MKNKTLYALWKYKVAFLVFVIIGFLVGFFVTSFIINNNFSYYETTIKTDVATNLIFNEDYFGERFDKIFDYNSKVTNYNNLITEYNGLVENYNKSHQQNIEKISDKCKYSTIYYWKFDDSKSSYMNIGDKIKINKLDDGSYSIKINYGKFSTSFVSSTQKTNEGINKCKKSITSILVASGKDLNGIPLDNNIISTSDIDFSLLLNGSNSSFNPKYNVEILSDFEIVDYHDPYFYGGITALSMLFLSIAFFFILTKGKNEDYYEDISDNENIFKTPFHKKYWAGSLKCFKNVKDLTILAMLFGMMLLMKMINLPSGFGALGLSFTYLFFSIIAMIYGPVAGLVIGAFSDILGFFIFPSSGSFFFGYTLDAMTAGFVYGICFYKTKLTFNKCLYARLFVNLVINVLFGSLWYMCVFVFVNMDGSTFEQYFNAYITYMSIISLPKNLIYLLPQTILLFIVLKAMTRPLSAFGLIDMRVREHVTLF